MILMAVPLRHQKPPSCRTYQALHHPQAASRPYPKHPAYTTPPEGSRDEQEPQMSRALARTHIQQQQPTVHKPPGAASLARSLGLPSLTGTLYIPTRAGHIYRAPTDLSLPLRTRRRGASLPPSYTLPSSMKEIQNGIPTSQP